MCLGHLVKAYHQPSGTPRWFEESECVWECIISLRYGVMCVRGRVPPTLSPRAADIYVMVQDPLEAVSASIPHPGIPARAFSSHDEVSHPSGLAYGLQVFTERILLYCVRFVPPWLSRTGQRGRPKPLDKLVSVF